MSHSSCGKSWLQWFERINVIAAPLIHVSALRYWNERDRQTSVAHFNQFHNQKYPIGLFQRLQYYYYFVYTNLALTPFSNVHIRKISHLNSNRNTKILATYRFFCPNRWMYFLDVIFSLWKWTTSIKFYRLNILI